MNIIICDDRIDDRKNLSDLLSDYGEKKNYEFAITEYDSGEQLCEEQSALEACQLLFLDINMQGMDGLKTAMRIKEKYPKLPVCTDDGLSSAQWENMILITETGNEILTY